MNDLNATLDKVINYGLPSTSSGSSMPECKHPKKSAEEMLKMALGFAYQGMRDSYPHGEHIDDPYTDGKYYAYEDMAAHLEMLIKEAKE